MRRLCSHRTLRALSAAAVLPFLLAPAPASTLCKKVNLLLGCKSATTLSVYTGSPTVPCLIGHPVVQITSQAKCQNQSAGPVVLLRCGALSDGFSYSGGSWTHTFGTLSNWETVLAGECDDLTWFPSQ